MVTTAHFLKSCAKVPKVLTVDEDSENGYESDDARKLIEKQQ